MSLAWSGGPRADGENKAKQIIVMEWLEELERRDHAYCLGESGESGWKVVRFDLHEFLDQFPTPNGR
jgi:hypothetical protein